MGRLERPTGWILPAKIGLSVNIYFQAELAKCNRVKYRRAHEPFGGGLRN